MFRHKTFYGGITESNYSQTPWINRTSAANNTWNFVTWGNGLFVAVSSTGTGNRVMTSPDGITWTSRTSAANNSWFGVTYGNGLFVAVSSDGTGNRVMTSPDGITWTSRTDAGSNSWRAVTYGNGLFVATASNGTGNRVMTSPDGITWTSRTSAADNGWYSVTYGNGLFVSVSNDGTGNRVMTSPDGIAWTSRTSAADNQWYSVTYGNGLFVAVSTTGTNNRVMTSPDGITWTSRTSAANYPWQGVTYGNGLFVAVSTSGGSSDFVMTSPNGITWTKGTSVPVPGYSVTYGNGLFVAVNQTGLGNRVMTWSPSSNNLNFDTSTKFVTYTTSNTVAINEGDGLTSSNTAAPVVNYNPASQSLTYNSTNPYYINDTFLLSANEYGSTMKATNVLISNLSQINSAYTVSNGGNTSRVCTSTVWVEKSCTVSGVLYYQRTAGSYTANNYNGFGLYKFSGVTGTLLASTASSSILLSGGANTFKKIPFSISNCTVSRGTYVIALVYSNSAEVTAPTVGGIDNFLSTITGVPSYNLTNGAKFSGFINNVAAIPNPLMWSNLTQGGANNSTLCPWFSLY